MLDLIEELRAAGKLPDDWDDEMELDWAWIKSQLPRESGTGSGRLARCLRLPNGDHLTVRRRAGVNEFNYHRTGGQYGSREMRFGGDCGKAPTTRGEFRWLMSSLRAAAKHGYRLGLLTRSSERGPCGEICYRLYKEGDGPT